MIRHLFKLIWNQKRKYLGLSIEMFFSFLVLFAVFTFGIFNLQRYVEPLGFEYDDVWDLSLDAKGDTGKLFFETLRLVEQHLENYPEVVSVSSSYSNVPFGMSTNTTVLKHGEVSLSADVYRVGEDHFEVLDLKPIQGRFFGPEDDGAGLESVVITESMAKAFFGEETAVGEVIEGSGEEKLRVIGLAPAGRFRGEFSEKRHGFF
ncbi:MAG: ABC transporter permease, partial [Bacteroidota bacterium]